MNTVSPSSSRMGLIPSATISLSWVLIPMAAMAVARHHNETSLPICCTCDGIHPALLITTKPRNATANHGSSGGRSVSAESPPAARVISAATTITGNSMATRISFTTVAVSPISGDML